jgi:hypothetical protein
VLRRLFLCALAAALPAGAGRVPAAFAAQNADAQKAEKPKKEEAPKPVKGADKAVTAEGIAETVVLVYGTRAGLQQIRRTGVERGRITRTGSDGSPQEITYERAFKRGDTFEKDKIRLVQRMPAIEYSLIFSDGHVTGMLRGTPFTPKEEDVTTLLTERVHGIDALLRYKESGAAVKYTGKESQKGLDLWVLELTDKESRATRYFISSKTGRILWLEYEEGPVKYKRTFHDYRVVQGTLVPYRTVLYAGDRQVEESQVLTVTYGVKMEDAVFSPEAASIEP